MEGRLNDLKTELRKQAALQRATLDVEVPALQAQVAAFQKEVPALQAQVTALKKEVPALQAQVVTLKKEVADLKGGGQNGGAGQQGQRKQPRRGPIKGGNGGPPERPQNRT